MPFKLYRDVACSGLHTQCHIAFFQSASEKTLQIDEISTRRIRATRTVPHMLNTIYDHVNVDIEELDTAKDLISHYEKRFDSQE